MAKDIWPFCSFGPFVHLALIYSVSGGCSVNIKVAKTNMNMVKRV